MTDEDINALLQDPENIQIEIEDTEDQQPEEQKTDAFEEFEKYCTKAYDTLIKDIRRRVRENYDIVICIDGREGVGKSKFGLKLGRDLDSDFTVQKNVLLRPTPETIEKRIFEIKKYGVLMLDEAMDVLYKRTSTSSENIGINQLFARVRKFNRIVILALPNFNDLDKFFRERRVQIRFNCIDRGIGWIGIAKDIAGIPDCWFSDYNSKIAEEHIDELNSISTTPFDKLAIYENFKGFYSPFLWKDDDVPADIWHEYEEMAKESNLQAAIAEKKKEEEMPIHEKKYRYYFCALAIRYMQEQGISIDELHKTLNQAIGAELLTLPTIEKTIKAFSKLNPEKNEPIKKIDLLAIDEEIKKAQEKERIEKLRKRLDADGHTD